MCCGVKVYTNEGYNSVELTWAFFVVLFKALSLFNGFAVHSLGCVQQETDTKFLEECIEWYMDCLTQISIPGVY